jgi:hypothetical protein
MNFVLKIDRDTNDEFLNKVTGSVDYNFGMMISELEGNIIYSNQTVHLFIIEKIEEKKTIFVPKKFNEPLTTEQLIVTDSNTEKEILEAEKIALITEIEFVLNSRVSKATMFDIMNYMTSLVEILVYSKTIINDENKEDVFIEMISQDEDGEKIEMLKRYNDAKERFNNLGSFISHYNLFKNQINNAQSTEDLKVVKTEFYTIFN